MKCKNCGSTNLIIINESNVHSKNRGLFRWLLWILLAICTCGLILIIPLLTNKKIKTSNCQMVICKDCGHKYNIEELKTKSEEELLKEKEDKKVKIISIIALIFVIILLILFGK